MSQSPKPRLGFIGLGLMGQPMSLRLLQAGYPLSVHDRNPEQLTTAIEHGAQAAATPAEIMTASDIVLLCLVSTDAVVEVTRGPTGLLSTGSAGKLIIDCSTSEVDTTRQLAAQAASEHYIGWLDAPVSGGPPAAAAGRLTMMAGGSEQDFARAQPILRELAEQVTLMGPVGAGQVTKMINQVLVLNQFCVLAEALKLAENNGVDASQIPDCLAGGYADSAMLRQFFPRLLARDFAPAGYARQVLKDLDMVDALAKNSKTPLPMTSQARLLYRLLIARGYSELDAIAILKLYDSEPL
ncbi:MAG: NAD(P)-dependent oxidoreductase [Candidatus Competibacteraceae bacterium]|nr:NAD(P)-dependent oxidoreductase [Candidatus Competibacteraceae bacterium]MCB1811706.1 NAD(P)-dependent oxidoreductase [Candidatus Competibacteraceae bacterium]